jgi:predicted  nucleic acid-binding Zn-ribbon protein
MSQAFHLAQLQKVDTQLDQIQNRLNEIDRVLKSNQSLQQAQAEAKAAKERVFQAQQTLRSAEDAVQAQRIKIELSESSLYGGKIRSPKELQDLQAEIASLKKHMATLEDTQLDAMVALEQIEDDQKKADQRITLVQAELASQSASLLGEQGMLVKNQDRFQTERQAVLPQISAENIVVYNRLREQKRGMAVSQVEDGACKGCGSSLRPAEIQAARSPSQLVRCSTCGRILYAG